MQLTDFDELLMTHRIWTDGSHIEQQLSNLTEHMENVFQKYLRDEFKTIEEFNEKAGEVAEPYRVLVVANYPSGFSERATQRLKSIIQSGPTCGVHTIISVDRKAQMPAGGSGRPQRQQEWELRSLQRTFRTLHLKYPAAPRIYAICRIRLSHRCIIIGRNLKALPTLHGALPDS